MKEFKSMPLGNFYERFNIPKDVIKLLFVGRLYPEKSIDTLIKAVPHIIKKHSNIHVMLVGAGHQRSKLEKLVKKLGVNKYVTFLGLVSEEDKILAYNACDIFVLPSLAELEGMVVLEAMASGACIIVSKVGGLSYLVTDKKDGRFFKSGDLQNLSEIIWELLNNDKQRKDLGKSAIASSQKYCWDIQAEKVVSIYKKLIRPVEKL